MSVVDRIHEIYKERGVHGVLQSVYFAGHNTAYDLAITLTNIIKARRKILYTPESINTLSDRKTLKYLHNNDVGIIRFGDGELRYLVGRGTSHEYFDSFLQDKLVTQLRNYSTNVYQSQYLIALPISLTLENKFEQRATSSDSWGHVQKYAMMPHLKRHVVYGSPFCFRLNFVTDPNLEEYSQTMLSLLDKKNTIYVSNENEVEDYISPVEFLRIPSNNAFESYDEIKAEVINRATKYENPVILISGGVTATAMSAELNASGFRTYDVGQFYRGLPLDHVE